MIKISENQRIVKENFLKSIIKKALNKDLVKEIIWFLKERKILKPYARFLDIKGDFIKIFYTSETVKPYMGKCDWAFGPFYESELNHPRYMRIPIYIMSEDNFNLIKRKQFFNKK